MPNTETLGEWPRRILAIVADAPGGMPRDEFGHHTALIATTLTLRGLAKWRDGALHITDEGRRALRETDHG